MRDWLAVFALTGLSALAQDTGCPNYPAAARSELLRSIELEQMAAQFAASAGKARPPCAAAPRNNFVDEPIFGA